MSRSNSHTTESPTPVIVVAAGATPTEAEASIQEVRSLLQGLEFLVVHTFVQRNAPKGAATILGEGKLRELTSLIEEVEATYGEVPFLAFVSEITPSQQRTLERQFGTVVLDRTGIILRVFDSRARTRLSKLEIELARLIYSMPRVRDDKSLDDREGGGGRGGRGNSNVELAKQKFRDRCAEIRREIEVQQTERRRRGERRQEAASVALVGYTNAGKSSWMRALTGSEVLVKDQLFATLDTTVRALQPETVPRILVTDTVGFIQDLPHALLASFRSTLDEALDTKLLLHILDGADPRIAEHYAVTQQVLEEVGAGELATRLIISKLDLVSPELRASLEETYPDALFLSAHTPGDAEKLRQYLVAHFEDGLKEFTFQIPFNEFGKLHALRQAAKVVREQHNETGVSITFLTNSTTLQRFGLVERPAKQSQKSWES